jgi:hypothetical protein
MKHWCFDVLHEEEERVRQLTMEKTWNQTKNQTSRLVSDFAWRGTRAVDPVTARDILVTQILAHTPLPLGREVGWIQRAWDYASSRIHAIAMESIIQLNPLCRVPEAAAETAMDNSLHDFVMDHLHLQVLTQAHRLMIVNGVDILADSVELWRWPY